MKELGCREVEMQWTVPFFLYHSLSACLGVL